MVFTTMHTHIETWPHWRSQHKLISQVARHEPMAVKPFRHVDDVREEQTSWHGTKYWYDRYSVKEVLHFIDLSLLCAWYYIQAG